MQKINTALSLSPPRPRCRFRQRSFRLPLEKKNRRSRFGSDDFLVGVVIPNFFEKQAISTDKG
jgi:hypothetical protein